MKIQHQSPHLTIFESAIYRTTTTLIKGKDYLLLIDPNWLPIEIAFIQQIVEEEESGKEKFLLFTHSDYDHILGYKAFPDFKTIASQAFVDKADKEQVVEEIRKFDDEYYVERPYLIEYPNINIALNEPITKMSLQEDQYTFYQAKGHTNDGLLVWNQTKGILVVGDHLSNIEFPFIYDSLSNYRRTLQSLQQIIATNQVAILITGHGDSTTDVSEMKRRITADLQYLVDLEQSIIAGTPVDLSSLLAQYPFPKGLAKCHQDNIVLVEKEFLRKDH